MIIKVTYSPMYGTDQSTRTQFVRVGGETHFVEVDGETWLRVDDMMNTGIDKLLSFDQRDATYFDGYTEASKLIPLIETWAGLREMMIDDIQIVRMGG